MIKRLAKALNIEVKFLKILIVRLIADARLGLREFYCPILLVKNNYSSLREQAATKAYLLPVTFSSKSLPCSTKLFSESVAWDSLTLLILALSSGLKI